MGGLEGVALEDRDGNLDGYYSGVFPFGDGRRLVQSTKEKTGSCNV